MNVLRIICAIILIKHKGATHMGKKFQVVLPDWMEEYLQTIANQLDLTVSELLRLELSLGFIFFIDSIFAQFKAPNLEIFGIPKANAVQWLENLDRDKMRTILSRISFEARKATDYHLNANKKQKIRK